MENNYWENLNQPQHTTSGTPNPYGTAAPSADAAVSTAVSTVYSSYNVPYPVPTTSKKKKKDKRYTALILLLCLLISVLGGYIGALLANNSEDYTTPATIAPGVFYQPVEHAISSTEGNSSNSLKEVIAAIQDSVDEIITEEPINSPFCEQSVETGAGSGVIISKDGYIITCAHVIQDSSSLQITLRDGTIYKAEVIGMPDDIHDIALLKIDAEDLTPAVIGNSDMLEVGEDAIVIENPLGSFGGTVTNGIISALEREVVVEGTSMVLMQTNAAVNPGNSGGGIFNGAGELIGLINAKSMGNNIEGIGFAIPINFVMPIVEQLLNKGFVSTPAIGINAMYIGSRAAASEYGVERFGVYVDSLTPGKGAEAAGLLPQDFILTIDGKPIDNLNDISVALREHAVGDSIEIQVLRQKETLTFTVILSERNTSA